VNNENIKVAEHNVHRIKRFKLEAKFYEICGVRLFRKCVFALEKWIHRRDKGTNINYHIASMDSTAAKEFIKYLFYNGSIHMRNIAYYCIFCTIRYSLYPFFHHLDVIPLIFAIKDIYCVMLQRYNYIQIQLRLPRLDELRQTRINRKIKKTIQAIENADYDDSIRQADFQLIQKLRMSVENGESIVLNDEDREAYERLSQILTNAKEQ
jgi:hypothetical protein